LSAHILGNHVRLFLTFNLLKHFNQEFQACYNAGVR
jgi:hypothetical protein